MSDSPFFTLEFTDANCAARAGKICTDHGEILTPIFMPVGTQGSVKAVPQHDLIDTIQAQIILGNTYHLFLRPGNETMKMAGGLHEFMQWNRPILTDSGGYQVYSLSNTRKIKDDGVLFSSHIDGSKHFFTPENVVDTQRIIGSDIMMTLDECPPYPSDYKYAKKSLEMTLRWEKAARSYFIDTLPHYNHRQFQFGITQGSTFLDLRKESAHRLIDLDFEGNAIGGLAVGEPAEVMYDLTYETCQILPANKPRYLMGVGTPANILESIARGVDMFDCVMPTRNARHGIFFTTEGIKNIKNAKYKNDFSPLDESYISPLTFTKAYIRHLFIAEEILAMYVLSVHNLCFYLWLVKTAREKILTGDFLSWKIEIIEKISKRV